MAKSLELYGFWRSIASFRVRVALRLKGLEFQEISVDLLAGAQFAAEYREINPQEVVPTLVDGDAVLFQSMAIIEYLDEVYAQPPLLPKAPLERAHARALALIAVADSHPLIVPRVRRRLSADFGCDEAAAHHWAADWTARGLETYETLLGRRPPAPYALGERVGLADICIASQTVAAGFFGVELAPFPLIAGLTDQCFALPAFADSHPLRQTGAPASA